MRIQTGNEFLDQVITMLTRRYNYTIQSDLIDGGCLQFSECGDGSSNQYY